MVNIIGDIAGEYDAFLRLLRKMPDEEVISVGDMIDRGMKSKEVVEWFMKNGKAVLGNHEHMMLSSLRCLNFYDHGIWLFNGGNATLMSFNGLVPEEVITWVEYLPLYLEVDGNLISHSFIDADLSLEEACDFGGAVWEKGETTIIWNRCNPIRRPEWKMQIAGHNSQMGFTKFSDAQGDFAICLDDSRMKRLTGLHLPSYTVYQEEY